MKKYIIKNGIETLIDLTDESKGHIGTHYTSFLAGNNPVRWYVRETGAPYPENLKITEYDYLITRTEG